MAIYNTKKKTREKEGIKENKQFQLPTEILCANNKACFMTGVHKHI